MERKLQPVDPCTGTILMPGRQGMDCLGNGEHPGYQCCCDECGYYLECFPDWTGTQNAE